MLTMRTCEPSAWPISIAGLYLLTFGLDGCCCFSGNRSINWLKEIPEGLQVAIDEIMAETQPEDACSIDHEGATSGRGLRARHAE